LKGETADKQKEQVRFASSGAIYPDPTVMFHSSGRDDGNVIPVILYGTMFQSGPRCTPSLQDR
jgi:hypothetical protein